MLPQIVFVKNGVIWCNLGASQSIVLPTQNNNNFKDKNQQENLIAIFLSHISLHKHVSIKILTPQKQKNFFKNQTKWRLFLIIIIFFFFFLLFGKAPYIPKIMSLLPSSPKIITCTSAPQLPENK